jgi:hypothetical protein
MMRRPMQAPPMNGPRFNEWIQSPKVRVIDHEGENLGVMYTREAMAQAQELGLDLVAYADYPYAAVYGWPAWVTRTPPHPMLDPEVAWAPVRRRLTPHGLTRDVVIDLDRATQQAKLAAFGCYASQVEVCEFGPSRMVSGPARLRHELLLTRPA